MLRDKDFTPGGIKIEGAYENDRNADYAKLYKDIIREVFGVKDVIVAHHLCYETHEPRADGFDYHFVEEIPSADTLIFDHAVAKKLWGDNNYRSVLSDLALEPTETRDDLLAKLYYNRPGQQV